MGLAVVVFSALRFEFVDRPVDGNEVLAVRLLAAAESDGPVLRSDLSRCVGSRAALRFLHCHRFC